MRSKKSITFRRSWKGREPQWSVVERQLRWRDVEGSASSSLSLRSSSFKVECGSVMSKWLSIPRYISAIGILLAL